MFRFRRAGGMIAGLGMFFLYFSFLLLALHLVGTNAGLYYRLQMDAQILPGAGVSREELIRLDENLADYLAGDASALDESPFNEKERIHMEDCYKLFVLLRRSIAVAALLAAALLMCAAAAGFRRFGRAAGGGALGFGAVILLLGIWGIADFDSLFTIFHRVLFTNDLWLLDPRTDLLIRICPQSMFSTMALYIAGAELGFILLVNVILRALPAVFGRHK